MTKHKKTSHTNHSNQQKWPPLFTVLTLVLILMSLLAAVLLLRDKWVIHLATLDAERSETLFEGQLYFSLMRPTEGGNPVFSTYTSNVADKDALLKLHDFDSLSENAVDPEVSQISFSPNGQWVTFVAKNKVLIEGEATEADEAYALQVYRASLLDSSLGIAIANAEQITDIVAFGKSKPSINNNGEVLFMSRGIETHSFDTALSKTPNDWVIHYIDMSGEVSDLSTGRYPTWLNANEFLYVSEDGMQHHDLSTGQSVTILTDNKEEFGDIAPHLMFDISDDGSLVVISTTNFGRVYVYDVVERSRQVPVFNLIALHDGVQTFWPQISPDNQYVGLLQYDPPRYGIYPLDVINPLIDPISVADFDVENMLVTDWR